MNQRDAKDDWLDGLAEGVTCPFCKETDFDLVGLKIHLLSQRCEAMNDIPVLLPRTICSTEETRRVK